MADQTDTHDNDTKTRANLAYFWSVIAALILGYIVVKWGDQKEILTLIIGLIGGTVIGGIFGIYFGGSLAKKPDTQVSVTGDNQQTTVAPTNTPTDANTTPNS